MKSIVTEAHINSPIDYLIICCCLMISFVLTKRLITIYKAKFWLLYFFLVIYHFGFTILYYFKTKVEVTGDSSHYYMRIVAPENYYDPTIKFGFSTHFIKSIVYLFYESMHLSYLSFFFIFSTIGYAGFFLFAKILRLSGFDKSKRYLGLYIMPLILFLPNQHIWTVALGKDSLMFFSLMLFTFSLINIKKNLIAFIISSFLIFMIRPQIFILVISSVGLATFFDNNRITFKKFLFLIASFVSGYFALKLLVTSMLKIPFTLFDIQLYLEAREGFYAKREYGGSIVDTSGYFFISKLFSYLYRPLFEKLNFNYFMIGIDNVISIVITLIIFKKKFFKWLRHSPMYIKFSFIFFIVGSSFFASLFSNFGISVRQKTQFVFSLYIVLLVFISCNHGRKFQLSS